MDRKRQILDAARTLFLEEGLDGLSMRRIARKVGITATAIYRHFSSKDVLLRGLVAEGFSIFASYLFQSLDAPDPVSRLARTGELYIRFALDHPRSYRIIFMSWSELDPKLYHYHECPADEDDDPKGMEKSKRFGSTFQFLVDRVQECIREGAFSSSDDPVDVAVYLWAVCHGLASMYLTGGLSSLLTREEFTNLAKRHIHRAISGLR